MTTMMEDVKVLLRQLGRAIGTPGTPANVITVVALGIVLNVAALSMVKSVRREQRPSCERTALRSAARTELKVARTMMASTLKKIGRGQRGWCLAQCGIEGLQRTVAKFTGDWAV